MPRPLSEISSSDTNRSRARSGTPAHGGAGTSKTALNDDAILRRVVSGRSPASESGLGLSKTPPPSLPPGNLHQHQAALLQAQRMSMSSPTGTTPQIIHGAQWAGPGWDPYQQNVEVTRAAPQAYRFTSQEPPTLSPYISSAPQQHQHSASPNLPTKQAPSAAWAAPQTYHASQPSMPSSSSFLPQLRQQHHVTPPKHQTRAAPPSIKPTMQLPMAASQPAAMYSQVPAEAGPSAARLTLSQPASMFHHHHLTAPATSPLDPTVWQPAPGFNDGHNSLHMSASKLAFLRAQKFHLPSHDLLDYAEMTDFDLHPSWMEAGMPGGAKHAAELEESQKEARKHLLKLLRIPDVDIPPDARIDTPLQMACQLMEHQKVALQWLKDQEKDKHKRGGLLADTMGLGKTIEALALILSNRPPTGSGPKTTLIIAPLALLKQWEREIESKVKPAYRLRTLIYHGREKKTKKAARLLEYDVVFTTYESVASEYKRYLASRRRQTSLFGSSRRFHRIILDEAHKIKNRKAQCSLAVVELDAKYRLCMTGTPFHNNTAEIYSLIRFLHIKPYEDWTRFNEHIEKPLRGWEKDEQAEGMRKLQVLFRSITLRRTKESLLDGKPIIVLPEVTATPTPAEFDGDQREFYDALERRQQIRFNKYVKQGKLSKVYTFILVLLLRLRQACCHPFLIKSHGVPDEAQLNGKEMVTLAMRLGPDIIDRILAKTEFVCPLCGDIAETPIIIFPCGHDICSGCFSTMMQLAHEGKTNAEDSQHALMMADGEVDTTCPGDDCDCVILPKKVLCHEFFLDAHAPEDGLQCVGEYSEDEDEGESDSCASDDELEDDSDDEEASLKDFIVSDDEQSDLTEQDGDDDDDDESESDDKDSKAGKAVKWLKQEDMEGPKSTPGPSRSSGLDADSKTQKREHHGDMDSSRDLEPSSFLSNAEDEGDKEPTLDSNAVAGSGVESNHESSDSDGDDLWARVLRHYNEPKNSKSTPQDDFDDDDDESDLESLLDLTTYRDKKSVVKPKTVKAQPSKPEPSTSKRKRENEEESLPKKKVKKEQPKTNFKKEERKPDKKEMKKMKKKKPKVLTLAQLKKNASTSRAAKAKYFERLRRDFESSAKIDVTVDLLTSIRNEKPKEKTLVFSLWTSFLDLLEIPLQNHGFRYLRYDGSMSFTERDDNVKRFTEDPNVKILLVSLMAGNAGLNLTAASQVIVLEPFWNPFVEDQAVDRAHRIGQKRRVEVHRILVANTVEDRILNLQEKKRNLVNTALSEEGAQGAGRLTINELRGLFGI